MHARRYPVRAPLDLRRTLAPLSRGRGDPTIHLAAGRAWLATRTADGPASVALVHRDAEPAAEAWGPGAERLLDGVPALLGLEAARPGDPAGAPARRPARAPRAGDPHPAHRGRPRIARPGHPRAEGDRAGGPSSVVRPDPRPRRARPGPAPSGGSACGPAPATLAALPYYAYHPFGVEQRRAEVIRRVASRAAWFEAIVDLPLPERLRAADGRARDRAVDRGRGRRPGARRPRRGERRRLPPARTWWRLPWPASRAAPTRGCSSCSSRTAASGPGSCACSS